MSVGCNRFRVVVKCLLLELVALVAEPVAPPHHVARAVIGRDT